MLFPEKPCLVPHRPINRLFDTFAQLALSLHPQNAPVAKMVDAPDLGSGNSGCVDLSPIRRSGNNKTR